MIKEDFYKLHIGQKIYKNGRGVSINLLRSAYFSLFISFTDTCGENDFECIMADLSFDPPKAKKRFWQWKINDTHWYRHDEYLDEKGVCTNGMRFFETNWYELEKIKIEDDFIDAKVE